MSTQGWIGVDLDGTLAHYDGWKGAEQVGQPVMPMVDRVKRWLSEGKPVRIFTARVSAHDEDELAAAVKSINAWSQEHIGQVLPVTCIKDYAMIELWDDRAVQVEMNTGVPVGFSTRGLQ